MDGQTLSNDLMDLPIIRAQSPSTFRTESNPYVAELESAENNCSSELSDLDSHYFEEFSSEEEQEVYEEEEDVEGEHNSGIMTGGEILESAQSIGSNYAEESTPVLPTNIRSPPVETMFLQTFSPLIPLLMVEHLIRLPGPLKSHLLWKFVLQPNLKSQNQLIFCPSWFNKLLQIMNCNIKWSLLNLIRYYWILMQFSLREYQRCMLLQLWKFLFVRPLHRFLASLHHMMGMPRRMLQ